MSFAPVYDDRSRALILGTWPSPKSREMAFYYGHPQNRFWPLLAALTGESLPAREDIAAKKQLLLRHGLALWDTLESCTITGASDASIKDVVPRYRRAAAQSTYKGGVLQRRHGISYLHKISAVPYRHPGCSSAQYKPCQCCLQPCPAGSALGRSAGRLDRKIMTRL